MMMYTQTAAPNGLDLLIRNALTIAHEAGRAEVASRLEAALSASHAGAAPVYELDILAGEVRLDGAVVALSRGERALLIGLALQRRPCTREELIELLYPHLDPRTVAGQLKVYLHRVRRRLGDPRAIIFKDETYRVGPNVAVDLWAVEAEVSAATKTRGPLARGARARLSVIRERLLRRSLAWAGEQEWCATLDRRLSTLLFDVTTRLGEAALAEGDLATASRLAAEIFEVDPCDERGAELAIRAALTSGDRTAATQQFRRYERVLKAEFDAQPSAELAALLS